MGYALHVIADMGGFIGLVSLLLTPFVLVWKEFAGTFRASNLWTFAIIFGFGIACRLLLEISWRLAERKGFHYDYEPDVATWIESGERVTYKA